jgi:hypothetical protein
MALQRPPPPQQKKSGLGCFGCGCVILLVILFLLLGLVAGMSYFGYKGLVSMTSSAPADIPAYNGSEDIYTGAEKKIDAFNQDVNNAKPSTLTLNSDEINSIIAHDPDLTKRQIRVQVTLTGDEARVESILPTDSIPFVSNFVKGRYLNLDTTFALTFNSDTKMVGLDLHKMALGETPVQQSSLPAMQAEVMPFINTQLRRYAACKNALEVAKTVAVKDGQLVIETK